MKPVITIGILLTILTFPGCLEETGLKGLPNLTTNGENTIGCVVNGKTVYNIYTSNAEAHWNTDLLQLSIDVYFNDKSNLTVYLSAPDPKVVDFKIDSTIVLDSISSVHYLTNEGCSYSVGATMDTDVRNVMNIHFVRFDTSGDSGVISATFDLILKKDGCPDLEITDGRFDIMIGDKPHIGPF